MNPIYFPFTWISPDELQAVRTFFDKLILLQPSTFSPDSGMAPAQPAEGLERRFPVTEDPERLAAVMRSYHDWAGLHQGAALSTLKSRLQQPPFFSDNMISQIKGDIQKHPMDKERRQAEGDAQMDPLFRSRLFLLLAQAHDQANFQLKNELGHIEHKQQAMMDLLSGADRDQEDDAEGRSGHRRFPSAMGTDPYLTMIPERLAAWAQLLAYESSLSGLFVTCSASLFEAVMDQCRDYTQVCDVYAPCFSTRANGEMGHQERLTQYFEAVAKNSWPPQDELPVIASGQDKNAVLCRLKVVAILDESPEYFWGERFLKEKSVRSEKKLVSAYQNTLLGLIEKRL